MKFSAIYQQFPTQESCVAYLEKLRWNNIPTCPYCGSQKSSRMKNYKLHMCTTCNISYSVTVGTIFHNTKVPLRDWFVAITYLLEARKSISAKQMQRHLSFGSYETAWRLNHKIRKAMDEGNLPKWFSDVIEMDETYVGGKPRKFRKEKVKRGRGTNKTPVIGVLDRGNKKVRAVVALPNEKGKKLSGNQLLKVFEATVIKGDVTVMTDQFTGYRIFEKKGYVRKWVDHHKRFVNGDIHTNGIESFWALIKRGVYGTFHSLSIKYLQQYVNEFCFRYNNRDLDIAFDVIVNNGLFNVKVANQKRI